MGHALLLFPSRRDSPYDQVVNFYDLEILHIFVNLLLRATPPAQSSERGQSLQADGLGALQLMDNRVRTRNSALLREGLPPLAQGLPQTFPGIPNVDFLKSIVPASSSTLSCPPQAGHIMWGLPLQISAMGTKTKASFQWSVLPQEANWELNQTTKQNLKAGSVSILWTHVGLHFQSCQGKAISSEHSIQHVQKTQQQLLFVNQSNYN